MIATPPSWSASVHDFYTYWFADMGSDYEAAISSLLARTYPRVQLALNSSGQGECALAEGMAEFLKEQHLIIAMVMLNIPGLRLETEQRTMYNDMFNATMGSIADGTMRVCQGDTSKNVPVSGRVINYG